MFQIDFFELLFLAETCIPPQPIARAMFWHKLIDTHFHSMSEDQRDRFYTFIKEKIESQTKTFNKAPERDTLMLLARYDPDNQYEIAGVFDITSCFLFEDKYYVAINTFVDDQYVELVKKKTLKP